MTKRERSALARRCAVWTLLRAEGRLNVSGIATLCGLTVQQARAAVRALERARLVYEEKTYAVTSRGRKSAPK